MKLTAMREDLLLRCRVSSVWSSAARPCRCSPTCCFCTHDGKLSVTGTDLEVELVAATQVTVQQPGDITVPGRKLLDIFRSLPEKTSISLTTEGERVSLRAGRSRFTLSSLPAAEFPLVEEINAQQTLTVAAGRIPPADRQDPFLDGATGCALLPEWYCCSKPTARHCAQSPPTVTGLRCARWSFRQSEKHTPGHRAAQGCARAATHPGHRGKHRARDRD